jgi:predicted transposase YdaD
MPHPFDAANKYILDHFPADWIALAGLPPGTVTQIADADLSSVSRAADKLVRVEAPEPYAAHIEFQSGPDARFDSRILVYNVLAEDSLGLRVLSVAFLLRPEALTAQTTGKVSRRAGADHSLEFRYKLVKVWELPVETLLAADLGTLPLAPISAVKETELPGVIEAMKRRFDAEAPGDFIGELWTATRILMGLRYSDEMVANLLRGVRNMKESSTYQAILREGKQQGIDDGRAREARALLIRAGRRQLGVPAPAVLTRIEAIDDVPRLEALFDRAMDGSARTWNELLDLSGA